MFFVKRKHPQDYLADYAPDKAYLSGLLTGLIAGLAVGFLVAPRSGKDLRKQIADTVHDQTQVAKNHWDQTKAQARETIDTVKTSVGLATDKAEDELYAYVDKARTFANEAEQEADKALKEADILARETRADIDKFRNTSNQVPG